MIFTRKELFAAFREYTSKSSNAYDEKFTKKIKKIKPEWLINKFDISKQTKKKIIKLAKSDEQKPHHASKLRKAIYRYTNKNSESYDEKFTKELKEIKPGWVITRTNIANKTKKEIIKIAKTNIPKPMHNSKLGEAIYRYTNKKSKSYDEEFTNQLKKIKPTWVITRADIANKNKQDIIKLAKLGKSRPPKTTRLGAYLSNCINKNNYSYDAEFTKEIKKLRPDWFKARDDIVNEKKEKLIELAKSGMSRPKYRDSLGRVLSNYTNKKHQSYDEEFTNKIKKLRPDWFKK
jgi:hypothetical protein